MALITCYDAEGVPHQKEPVDARESCLHNGFTMTPPGGTEDETVTEYVPTKQELLSARAVLLTQKDALDQLEQQLNLRASDLDIREQALAEREAANQAEALRLTQIAVAPAVGAASPEIAGMTKAQLQAALDDKGVKYPAAADKAELQALLAGAPAA